MFLITEASFHFKDFLDNSLYDNYHGIVFTFLFYRCFFCGKVYFRYLAGLKENCKSSFHSLYSNSLCVWLAGATDFLQNNFTKGTKTIEN